MLRWRRRFLPCSLGEFPSDGAGNVNGRLARRNVFRVSPHREGKDRALLYCGGISRSDARTASVPPPSPFFFVQKGPESAMLDNSAPYWFRWVILKKVESNEVLSHGLIKCLF